MDYDSGLQVCEKWGKEDGPMGITGSYENKIEEVRFKMSSRENKQANNSPTQP